MTLLLRGFFLFLIGICLLGCSHKPSEKKQINVGAVDTIDHDFVATIDTTDKPLVFLIKVSKINPKAEKSISRKPIQVDLALKDSSGKIFAGRAGEQTYAEEQGSIFLTVRKSDMDEVSGKVKLVKNGLESGLYKVEPRVRICESGKAALHGPYQDTGSVAIPAANKITVDIK